MTGNKKNDDIMLQHLIESMPLEEFEDRSAKEMQYLVYEPFCEKSPLVIPSNISDAVLQQIPFYNLVRHLLSIIHKNEPLHLTAKGYIPPNYVKELYIQQYIQEEYSELKTNRQVCEFESIGVTNARIVCELAGLIKSRKKIMTLTQKAHNLINNKKNQDLFELILNIFTTKFNWAFNDGFGEIEIGQFGFAYSLDLIEKYGSIARNPEFYSQKYLSIFKPLLSYNPVENTQLTENEYILCYKFRTFQRFLNWFGLIKIWEETNEKGVEHFIEKSEIFNKIFQFE